MTSLLRGTGGYKQVTVAERSGLAGFVGPVSLEAYNQLSPLGPDMEEDRS